MLKEFLLDHKLHLLNCCFYSRMFFLIFRPLQHSVVAIEIIEWFHSVWLLSRGLRACPNAFNSRFGLSVRIYFRFMRFIFQHIFDDLNLFDHFPVFAANEPLIKGFINFNIVVDFGSESDSLHLSKLSLHFPISSCLLLLYLFLFVLIVLGWYGWIVFGRFFLHFFYLHSLMFFFDLLLFLLLFQNFFDLLFDVVDGFHIGWIVDWWSFFCVILLFCLLDCFLKKRQFDELLLGTTFIGRTWFILAVDGTSIGTKHRGLKILELIENIFQRGRNSSDMFDWLSLYLGRWCFTSCI